MMSVINLLASRNFIVVNKDLAKKIGLDEAILLGELASEYAYWGDRDELTEDGFFFSTVENVEVNTTFTQYKQAKALQKLQEEGLLYVDRRGLPAKRYIKLREDRILKLFAGNEYNVEFTPTARKTKREMDFSAEFEELWKMYPNKQGKSNSLKAYNKARKEGVTREEIETGLKRYIDFIQESNTPTQYIKHGSTWFGQRCWNDVYEVSKSRNGFYAMDQHDWDYDKLEALATKN